MSTTKPTRKRDDLNSLAAGIVERATGPATEPKTPAKPKQPSEANVLAGRIVGAATNPPKR